MTKLDPDILRELRDFPEVAIRTEKHPNDAVVIWVVVTDDGVFLRSVRGSKGRWYRDLATGGSATLEFAGRRLGVEALPVSDADAIARASREYLRKYQPSPYAIDSPRRGPADHIATGTALTTRSPPASQQTKHDQREGSMKLTIRPLTPDLWPALEDLFGDNGAVGGCWCMHWRIGSTYRNRLHKENRAAFREVVKRGPPPGLLAFDGDMAVGWCQLTPRDALPWLDRTWRLKRVDDVPVWSLSCFYVRKGYRRRGVTAALIAAALEAAKQAKATAVEAYPLDAEHTPSASGTGYASTFARAGFKAVARRVPPRPIMRHHLNAVGAP